MRSQPTMRLLSHPTILASIGLLALNDHILRKIWPSALTGKLGDFCWLFFFPALLAAVVTALAPARLRRRPERILAACMAVTGLVFLAANTLEPVRLWVQGTVTGLTGVRVLITRDPSDAIALLAFVPLWVLAERSRTALPTHGPQLASSFVAITLGVLLSLANSAAPNYGIDCLSSDGGALQASSSLYQDVFASRDGGLTWTPCPACTRTCTASRDQGGLVRHPEDPAIQYRYQSGEAIDRSEDGGMTWSTEYEFTAGHEATRSLFHLRNPGAWAVAPESPVAGLVDPVSGNAVFAMGYEGILLHIAATDRWEWVSVGDYAHMASPIPFSAAETATLLYVEIRLAILLGLLAAATLLIGGPHRRAAIIAALLPWAAFAVTWFASPALNRSSYLDVIVMMLLFGGYLTAAVHMLVFSRSQFSLARLPWLIGVFLASAVVFLVPYVLWAYTLLPRYFLASLLGLGAAGAVILIGWRLMR